MHGRSFVSMDEHYAEIERRTVATGAVACSREALRIAVEVDAGHIPRGRAEVILTGLLGIGPPDAKRFLDSKPEPSAPANGASQVPLVTAIQQAIATIGSADKMRGVLQEALDSYWKTNREAETVRQ